MSFDEAMANPAAIYRRPVDICKDAALSREQKIQVLRQWEYDARELEVAEEENMAGGPPDLLAEVLAALNELGADTAALDTSTKQGG